MKCPRCDATVDANQKFCKGCGKQLKKLKCKKCGQPLSIGDNFCGECGQKVVQQSGVPSPSVPKSQTTKEERKFLFVLHPHESSEEEESCENYKTWLEDKLYPLFNANSIAYKSPDDFEPGNYHKELQNFLESCTHVVVPVCAAVCTHMYMSVLSHHFTQAKPPIVLLPPRDIAGGVSPFNVGLQQYSKFNCKTDTDTEKTVIRLAKLMNSKAEVQSQQETEVMDCEQQTDTAAVSSPVTPSRTSRTSILKEADQDTQSTTSGNNACSNESLNLGTTQEVFRPVTRHDSEKSTGFNVPEPSPDKLTDDNMDEANINLEDALEDGSIYTGTRSSVKPTGDNVPTVALSEDSSSMTKSSSYPSRHTGEERSLLPRPKTTLIDHIQEPEYYPDTKTFTSAGTESDTVFQQYPKPPPLQEVTIHSYLPILTMRHCKVHVSNHEDGTDAIPNDPLAGASKSFSDLAESIYGGEASHISSVLSSMEDSTIIRYLLRNMYNNWSPKNLVCFGLIARYTKSGDVRMCALTYLSKALMKIRRFDDDYISNMKHLHKVIAPDCNQIDQAWGRSIKGNAAVLVVIACRMTAMVLLIHAISQKNVADLESLGNDITNSLEIVNQWKERYNLSSSNVDVMAEEHTLKGMGEEVKFIRERSPSQRDALVNLNYKLLNYTEANKKDFHFVGSFHPALKLALMFTVSSMFSGKFSDQIFNLQETLYSYIRKDRAFHWGDRVILLKCMVNQAGDVKDNDCVNKVLKILLDMNKRCRIALQQIGGRDFTDHKCDEILRDITKPLLFHCLPQVREQLISNVFHFVKKTEKFADTEVASVEDHSKTCMQEDLISYRLLVKDKVKEVSSHDDKHKLCVFSGRFGNYKEGVEVHCLYPRTKSESVHPPASSFEKVVEIYQKMQTANGKLSSDTSYLVKMLAHMWPGNGISYYVLYVGQRNQSLSSYMKERVLKENPNPVNSSVKGIFARSMISAVKHCNESDILVRNITLNSFRTCKQGDRREVKLYDLFMAEMDESGTGITGEKSIRLPLMWMAPESIFTGKYDEKSEVFSLALAIMELYSDGVHPYQEMDQASSAKKKITTILKYKMLPERRPGVPEEVYITLLMCLLPDPQKRLTINALYNCFQEICGTGVQECSKRQEIRNITKDLLLTQSNEPEMGIPEHLHDIHSWEEMWKKDEQSDFQVDHKNFMAGQYSQTVKDSESCCHDRPHDLAEGQKWICVVKRNFPQEEINRLKRICTDSEENKYLAVISTICRANPLVCKTDQHTGMILSLQGYDTLQDFALEEQLSATEKRNIYTYICRGMKYLHDNGIIHCSLQAKYIYVARRGGKINLRLGQLNRATLLCMDSNDKNMTQAVAKPFDELPQDILRWCPLETHEMGLMSMYSDVTQFGYTLWEVENCNTKDNAFPKKKLVPYFYLTTDSIPEAQKQRHSLPKPEGCEDWVYRLIELCISNPRCSRPLFDEILHILTERNPMDNDTLNLKRRHTYTPPDRQNLKRPPGTSGRSDRAKKLSVALQEECETVQNKIQSCPANLSGSSKRLAPDGNSNLTKKKWRVTNIFRIPRKKGVSRETNTKDKFNRSFDLLDSHGDKDNLPSSALNMRSIHSTSDLPECLVYADPDSVSFFSDSTFDEEGNPDKENLGRELKRNNVQEIRPQQVIAPTPQNHYGGARPKTQESNKQVDTVDDMRKNYPISSAEIQYVPTQSKASSLSFSQHTSSHNEPDEYYEDIDQLHKEYRNYRH